MKFKINFWQNKLHYQNGRWSRSIDHESTEPHIMEDQSLTEPRLVGLIEGLGGKQIFHLLRVVCITTSLILP
jgi:hypothetical protein